LAAVIASRRLQCEASHVPSFVSLAVLTVNVVCARAGPAAAAIIVNASAASTPHRFETHVPICMNAESGEPARSPSSCWRRVNLNREENSIGLSAAA
jgi:hypothetical protein